MEFKDKVVFIIGLIWGIGVVIVLVFVKQGSCLVLNGCYDFDDDMK